MRHLVIALFALSCSFLSNSANAGLFGSDCDDKAYQSYNKQWIEILKKRGVDVKKQDINCKLKINPITNWSHPDVNDGANHRHMCLPTLCHCFRVNARSQANENFLELCNFGFNQGSISYSTAEANKRAFEALVNYGQWGGGVIKSDVADSNSGDQLGMNACAGWCMGSEGGCKSENRIRFESLSQLCESGDKIDKKEPWNGRNVNWSFWENNESRFNQGLSPSTSGSKRGSK